MPERGKCGMSEEKLVEERGNLYFEKMRAEQAEGRSRRDALGRSAAGYHNSVCRGMH